MSSIGSPASPDTSLPAANVSIHFELYGCDPTTARAAAAAKLSDRGFVSYDRYSNKAAILKEIKFDTLFDATGCENIGSENVGELRLAFSEPHIAHGVAHDLHALYKAWPCDVDLILWRQDQPGGSFPENSKIMDDLGNRKLQLLTRLLVDVQIPSKNISSEMMTVEAKPGSLHNWGACGLFLRFKVQHSGNILAQKKNQMLIAKILNNGARDLFAIDTNHGTITALRGLEFRTLVHNDRTQDHQIAEPKDANLFVRVLNYVAQIVDDLQATMSIVSVIPPTQNDLLRTVAASRTMLIEKCLHKFGVPADMLQVLNRESEVGSPTASSKAPLIKQIVISPSVSNRFNQEEELGQGPRDKRQMGGFSTRPKIASAVGDVSRPDCPQNRQLQKMMKTDWGSQVPGSPGIQCRPERNNQGVPAVGSPLRQTRQIRSEDNKSPIARSHQAQKDLDPPAQRPRTIKVEIPPRAPKSPVQQPRNLKNVAQTPSSPNFPTRHMRPNSRQCEPPRSPSPQPQQSPPDRTRIPGSTPQLMRQHAIHASASRLNNQSIAEQTWDYVRPNQTRSRSPEPRAVGSASPGVLRSMSADNLQTLRGSSQMYDRAAGRLQKVQVRTELKKWINITNADEIPFLEEAIENAKRAGVLEDRVEQLYASAYGTLDRLRTAEKRRNAWLKSSKKSMRGLKASAGHRHCVEFDEIELKP